MKPQEYEINFRLNRSVIFQKYYVVLTDLTVRGNMNEPQNFGKRDNVNHFNLLVGTVATFFFCCL